MKTLLSMSIMLCSIGAAIAAGGGKYDVAAVRKAMRPLVFERTGFSEPVEEYFRYYGLDLDGVVHLFGSFKSGTRTLAVHVFRPGTSKGTVVLVHGYYDHAGILSKLIKELVTAGYTVAVYDQPGHGLSGGAPADIGDFGEYVAVLRDFVKLCTENLDSPFHLVAHSMGSGVASDYLLKSTETPFARVVLMAPLIRSAAWRLSGVGHAMAGSVVDSVPRVFRRNSSDKQFLKFMKRDPLQTKQVPMRWLKALRAWNERILKYEASDRQVRIIQGTKDTTVDWKHNMKFMKSKFPNADITMIDGAGHQLMNESEKLRGKVFEEITRYLGKPHTE